MKSKADYLLPDGSVNRMEFRHDIMKSAHTEGVPLCAVLRKFFASGDFTKVEMGRFALNTSVNGNLLEGVMVLIRVFGVTQDDASIVKVMEEYIGVSQSDPQIWGVSWIIDNFMDWPLGTILPSSRPQLDRTYQ